jgi:hypothetical protein
MAHNLQSSIEKAKNKITQLNQAFVKRGKYGIKN